MTNNPYSGRVLTSTVVLKWLLGLIIVTFLATVWPTAYRYHRYDNLVVRENRFTGKLQFLAETEWVGE